MFVNLRAEFCSYLWTVSIICCFVMSRLNKMLSCIQFQKTFPVFASITYGAILWTTSLDRMLNWSFLIGCLSIWRNVKSESNLLIDSKNNLPGCLENLLSFKLIRVIWSSQLQYNWSVFIKDLQFPFFGFTAKYVCGWCFLRNISIICKRFWSLAPVLSACCMRQPIDKGTFKHFDSGCTQINL